MDEIIVRYVKLPNTINGFVMEDPSGDGNIYINKDKPPEVQMETLYHEIRHFKRGHLKDFSKSVNECELEADMEKPQLFQQSRLKDEMNMKPNELVHNSNNSITEKISPQEVKYA